MTLNPASANYLESAAPELMDQFGRGVTYTQGGVSKTITALITDHDNKLAHYQDGRGEISGKNITIYNDSAIGITTPDIGDMVSVDSISFVVSEVVYSSPAMHKLALKRFDKTERAPNNFFVQR